jgi:hypothetical protein
MVWPSACIGAAKKRAIIKLIQTPYLPKTVIQLVIFVFIITRFSAAPYYVSELEEKHLQKLLIIVLYDNKLDLRTYSIK